MLLLMMSYMVVATAWTTLFFLAVQRDTVGVNAAISNGAGLLGSAIGGTLPPALLVVFGERHVLQRLEAAGAPQPLVDQALRALNIVLQMDAVDLSQQSLAALDRVINGYRLAYAVAFGQVLYVIAGVCLLCAVVMWFGMKRSDVVALLEHAPRE